MEDIDVQLAPKVVIIVGNGFDIDLKLRTRYKDFVESCYFKPLIENINFSYDEFGIIDFDDFKNEMILHSNELARYAFEEYEEKRWVDLETDIKEYCLQHTDSHNSETIRKELFAMRYALFKYMQIEIPKEYNFEIFRNSIAYETLRQLIEYNADFNIWNFNYTQTCHSILNDLNIPEDKINSELHYTHNNVVKSLGNHSVDIVLGTRYDKTIMRVCPSAIKANQFKGDYSQMKNIFNTHLKEAETIIVFGSTMGESDSQYFEDTFKSSVNLKKILVIDRDNQSIDKVKINMNNISDGKLMEKIEEGIIDYKQYATIDYYNKRYGYPEEKQKEKFGKLLEELVTYSTAGVGI